MRVLRLGERRAIPPSRWRHGTLGRALAAEGIGLVYGGGGRGLMGTLAPRRPAGRGGRVTGIIPDFLTDTDAVLRDAQEHVVVPDMHTRKRLMFERAATPSSHCPAASARSRNSLSR